jgi:hypothetical protein
MSVQGLLSSMNQEMKQFHLLFEKSIYPQIENLVTEIDTKMKLDGRLHWCWNLR